MKLFLILMAMGVVTYGTRSLPLLALGRRRIPEPVRRFFRGFPVAVLAAFAAPLILAPEGTLQLGYHNLGLMAAFPTLAVALWTRSLVAAVFVGAVAMMLLRMFM